MHGVVSWFLGVPNSMVSVFFSDTLPGITSQSPSLVSPMHCRPSGKTHVLVLVGYVCPIMYLPRQLPVIPAQEYTSTTGTAM